MDLDAVPEPKNRSGEERLTKLSSSQTNDDDHQQQPTTNKQQTTTNNNSMNPINLDPSLFAALLIATGAYAIWNTILRRKLLAKKPFDSLPMPLGNTALIGHIQMLTKNTNPAMSHLVTDCANEQGRTGFWLRNKPGMAVTHWEDARAILQAESQRDAPAIFQKHVGQMAGPNSILLLNGREWKIHRAAVRRHLEQRTTAAMKRPRQDT